MLDRRYAFHLQTEFIKPVTGRRLWQDGRRKCPLTARPRRWQGRAMGGMVTPLDRFGSE